MDRGLENAGWKVLSQLDCHVDAVETLRARTLSMGCATEVIHARIEDINPSSLRRSLGLKKGELGILAGGPPCQPFTTTGLRRALNDIRASSSFPHYLEFVSEFQPAVLLIENVDGMLSAALEHRPLCQRTEEHPQLRSDERKGSFLLWLLGQLGKLGYTIAWGVVEAADYGVPQLRQRSILIGVRGAEPCYLPPPAFGREALPPYRTVRSAIGGLRDRGPVQPLSERKRNVFRLVPPGGNWRNLPDDVRRDTMGAAYHAEGGKSGWWRRLAWDSPAPTILGMPDHSSTALIHPDEVRCLSVNECAALQSFPEGAQFAGSPRSQYQQIGNAVPPLLAESIGRHLLSFLEGHRMEAPAPPAWRQISANRRIGTHGWAIATRRGVEFHLCVKIRKDHVWSGRQQELPLG